MCGIVLTPSLEVVISAGLKMISRGTVAYSFWAISNSYSILYRKQENICFNTDVILQDVGIPRKDVLCYILHLQSPTAMEDFSNDRFHPAESIEDTSRSFLWHNGMMEASELEKLKVDNKKPWDTKLLLESIKDKNITSALDDFKGSFACIFLEENKGIYIFRNKISPLYVSKDGSICSTPLLSCKINQSLPPNTIYKYPTMEVSGLFKNLYNPYGI